MVYKINDIIQRKQQFIDFFQNLKNDLNGKEENVNVKNIFPNCDLGDIGTCKDLVGNALAILTNKDVTID